MGYRYAERLRRYRHAVDFDLELGEGPTLRAAREQVSTLDLSPVEQDELADIDAAAIDFIRSRDELAPYLLQDDPSQPLEKWWWHLGRIRQGTYPADRLPESLRLVLTGRPG